MKKIVNLVFPKPYCSGPLLILTVLISAVVVFFYHKEGEMKHDFYTVTHNVALLSTTLMIFFLFFTLGHISHVLDKWYPWLVDWRKRFLWQMLVGWLLLGIFAFQFVMVYYRGILGVALHHKDYFERDFVVGMAALLAVNYIHYSAYMRYNRRLLLLEKEKIQAEMLHIQRESLELQLDIDRRKVEIEALQQQIETIQEETERIRNLMESADPSPIARDSE